MNNLEIYANTIIAIMPHFKNEIENILEWCRDEFKYLKKYPKDPKDLTEDALLEIAYARIHLLIT